MSQSKKLNISNCILCKQKIVANWTNCNKFTERTVKVGLRSSMAIMCIIVYDLISQGISSWFLGLREDRSCPTDQRNTICIDIKQVYLRDCYK